MSGEKMKPNGNPNRHAAFKHAFAGMVEVFKSEPNTRIHLAATIAVIAISLLLKLSLTEWALILLAIGLVWTAELLNTAVEITVDMITEEYSEKAKKAKDLAAGGVLAGAVTAALIGLIVLGPKLLALLPLP